MIDALRDSIIAALKSCLPVDKGSVSLHEPWFCGNEWRYVKECLDTGWVSTVGSYVEKFEKMLVEYTGCGYAVATSTGTAALHIALKLAEVRQGDEVLIPALTFVATANAVDYCGGVPHFVDSDAVSLGIDPQKLGDYLSEIAQLKNGVCVNRITGRLIKAIIPMHTFGHPVDLDPLKDVCERYGLTMVEDAAEAIGSLYKGKHTGNMGLMAALSFNGNKTITTGGGGAILTNNLELAKRAKHITTTARTPSNWGFYHDEVGYNYRLPNINAALGCAQLEEMDRFVDNKRRLAERYMEAFKDIKGITVFKEPAYARSNYWLNVLMLDEDDARCRDELLESINGNGIMARPAWTLLHKLPMFKDSPRMDLKVAEELENRIINIPSSAFL
jgi:perosamine synthetase